MGRIVNYGENMRLLAKISIDIDIGTQLVSLALSNFGLGFNETIITPEPWKDYGMVLLKAKEN